MEWDSALVFAPKMRSQLKKETLYLLIFEKLKLNQKPLMFQSNVSVVAVEKIKDILCQ
jgi:hypothetical protein